MNKEEKKEILIIEDSNAINILLKQFLERLDYKKIHTCEDGESGIVKFQELVGAKNIPTVLLDYNLPDMNAFSVITQLLTIHPDTKVIIETASEKTEEGIKKTIAYGAHHYLQTDSNLFGVMAARLAGVAVVVTSEHGENPWKGPFHRWLERHVISPLADARFCVSPRILAIRRDVEGVPAWKLRLTVNGTLLPAIKVRQTMSSVPIIGAVGRLIPAKDYPGTRSRPLPASVFCRNSLEGRHFTTRR